MPVVEEIAVDDPRLDVFRDLRGRTWPDHFVGEGLTVVERVLASGHAVDAVVCERRLLDTLARQVPPGRPLYVVPDGALAEVAGFQFHKGVIVAGRRRPLRAVADLLPPADEPCTLLIAEATTDPENAGGLLRLAAALDVTAVVFGPASTDPYARRVLRTSMAACLAVPWTAVPKDVAKVVRTLSRDHGVETWATVLGHGATDLATIADRPRRVAVVVGNEGHGLSRPVREACDRLVTIPVSARVDSLNVVVATGIVLHHLRTPPRPAVPRPDQGSSDSATVQV